MRLSWRRSSRLEDRFEKWIARRHQERVLTGEVIPAGPCPEDAFLRDLARKSKRVALSDPRVDHVASCPGCMNRVLTLRRQNHSRQQKLVFAVAITSCLAIAFIFVALVRHRERGQLPAVNMAAVSKTVNLWDAGTIRGEQPGSLESVTLPAALVKITIILPRFSLPGQYAVTVTQDQTGNGVQAQSVAGTTSNQGREELSVNLDLRNAKAGAYFLSTTHEQDQASYYYPLQIQ